MTGIAATELATYEETWQLPAYAEHSPGEQAVPRFMRLVGPAAHARVIDFGCGTGRGGVALADLNFRVVLADQTPAGLCERALDHIFHRHCLWQPWPHARATYGYCVDVLEHVPTELTALSISRMLAACDVLYLEVATVPDQFGVWVGRALHQTVRPFTWWRDVCGEVGRLREGVDMLERAAFVLQERQRC